MKEWGTGKIVSSDTCMMGSGGGALLGDEIIRMILYCSERPRITSEISRNILESRNQYHNL